MTDIQARPIRKKHEDTRISAYPHSLEEVLEQALQVPPPDGKKRRTKGEPKQEQNQARH